MTAEELIGGLRERGCSILRSQMPDAWVIVARISSEDPLAPWLGERGAYMRPFQPEKWTRPELREYEANLSTVPVDVAFEPTGNADEDKHELARIRRAAIWEAAACPA